MALSGPGRCSRSGFAKCWATNREKRLTGPEKAPDLRERGRLRRRAHPFRQSCRLKCLQVVDGDVSHMGGLPGTSRCIQKLADL